MAAGAPSGNAAPIYFQRNRYKPADRVEFLINLAVASKLCWDWQLSRGPERGPRARPSALYVNDCPLWLRIGAPSSEGRGEGAWWTISTGMRLAPLAASVGQALGGRAIPLLGGQLTDAALCHWLEAHDPQQGWPPDTWRLLYLSVLLAAQGPSPRLDQVLAQLQDRAVQDPPPPWLAEHVTDTRQRATTAAADAARAAQPPNTTRPDPATSSGLPGAMKGRRRQRGRAGPGTGPQQPGRQPAAADRAPRLQLGGDRVPHLLRADGRH